MLIGQGGGPHFLDSHSFERLSIWLDPGGHRSRDEAIPAAATRIDGIGWIDVRAAHRREVPAIVAEPQPNPVDFALEPRADGALLVRYWRPGAARHCRLCAACNAGRNDRTGLDVCIKAVPAGLHPADAPLYDEPRAGPG